MDVDEFAKLLMDPQRKTWQDPDLIFDQILISPGCTIVDFGCGPGFFAIPFSKKLGTDGAIFAVDSSPEMLKHLSENLLLVDPQKTGAPIIEVEADVCKTGIASGSADIVLFANLLHDLERPENFLSEIKRVAKPSARILDIDWQKLETDDTGPPLERRLSENESRKLLRENGLRIAHALNAGPYHYGFLCRK